ncbi:hypothetical protein [Actinoallomurus iriomotensis]|uniref:Uncharacterized protein n=1 Tax=Actinoallomurus iriomotensis TaxID=478107 RepID=A0A9W6S9V7_9ACTN|nr:hypothetical protein [Actinoallomurus iriomotensis]GLY91106.1 hypothetical protein Airi02_090350 [Actinoallomurus iriomotensis]
MVGDWRTLWRLDRDHPPVEAGAIAIHPGDPARVVVTEEWAFYGLLKSDNTNYHALSDGREAGGWIMFKYPFTTPRIEVVEVDAAFAVVINTSRGIHVHCTDRELSLPDRLGDHDWYALDLVAGRRDGRPIVVAAWDVPRDDRGPHVQAYDLMTGAPAAKPWVPYGGWSEREQRRLGRCDGRPVAGTLDYFNNLHISDAATDFPERLIPLEEEGQSWLELLTVDDRAGPALALVLWPDGSVRCYDLAAEAPYCPPLTGCPGVPSGARLGRWRDRPAAALLTDVGVSLYDLQDRSWAGHVDLGAQAYDVAFAPQGELAIVSARGTLVVQLTP